MVFLESNIVLYTAILKSSLLVKGFSFSLPAKQFSYSDHLINFELCYRNIDNLKILSGDNLDLIKTRIKDINSMSFCNYEANLLQHLFSGELALKTVKNL